MRSLLFGFFLAMGLAAQQQPNTVTASVSITKTVNAGTAVFQIQFVDTSLTSTVDSAVGGLSTVGVASSNLTDVSVAVNQGYVVTTYTFAMPVPSGQFGATRDKLIALQRTLANSQTQAVGWSSSQIPSDDDIAGAVEQTLPDLLTRAKQRAGLLAQAMNASLGALLNLASPAVSGVAGPSVTFTLAATYAVTPAQ
jgi:hypothetical protein